MGSYKKHKTLIINVITKMKFSKKLLKIILLENKKNIYLQKLKH